ncbi:DgyrCDS4393 [Dimorphilus gyrociliatus]|uniref:DgyrCDS4393 n=1 Tax=Dimorphilus gyrociliatus TaxID=2664684 RepID=A0A7I8VIB1_9ANNE|nr:DgyrCDS4393 [Dimorphilus gyrociliatus]
MDGKNLNIDNETTNKRQYSDKLLRRLNKMNNEYRPLRIRRMKEFRVTNEGYEKQKGSQCCKKVNELLKEIERDEKLLKCCRNYCQFKSDNRLLNSKREKRESRSEKVTDKDKEQFTTSPQTGRPIWKETLIRENGIENVPALSSSSSKDVSILSSTETIENQIAFNTQGVWFDTNIDVNIFLSKGNPSYQPPTSEIEIDAQFILPLDAPVHVLIKPTNLCKGLNEGSSKWRRMMIIFRKVKDEIWGDIAIQPECDSEGYERRYKSNCIKTVLSGSLITVIIEISTKKSCYTIQLAYKLLKEKEYEILRAHNALLQISQAIESEGSIRSFLPGNARKTDEERRVGQTKANHLNNTDKSEACKKGNAKFLLTSSNNEKNRLGNEEHRSSPTEFKRSILKPENKKQAFDKDATVFSEVSSLKGYEDDEDSVMNKKKLLDKKRSKSRNYKRKRGGKGRKKSKSLPQQKEIFNSFPLKMEWDIHTNLNIHLKTADSSREICHRDVIISDNGAKTSTSCKPKMNERVNVKDKDEYLIKAEQKGYEESLRAKNDIEDAEESESGECKKNGPPPAYSHQSDRPSTNQLAHKELEDDVIYVGCDQTTPIKLPCGKIYLLDTRKNVTLHAKSMAKSERTEGQQPFSNERIGIRAETETSVPFTEGNATSNKGQHLQTVSLEELNKFESNHKRLEGGKDDFDLKQRKKYIKDKAEIQYRKSLPVPKLEENKQVRSYSMPARYKITDTGQQQWKNNVLEKDGSTILLSEDRGQQPTVSESCEIKKSGKESTIKSQEDEEEKKDVKWSFPISSTTFNCSCQEIDCPDCSQIIKIINTENLTNVERIAVVQLFRTIPDICVEESDNCKIILKIKMNTTSLPNEEKTLLNDLLHKCEHSPLFLDFEPAVFNLSDVKTADRLVFETLSSKAIGLKVKCSNGELIIPKPLDYTKLTENEAITLKKLVEKLKNSKRLFDSSIRLPIIAKKQNQKESSQVYNLEQNDFSRGSDGDIICENDSKYSGGKSRDKSLSKQSSPEEVQKITEAQFSNKDDANRNIPPQAYVDNETNQAESDTKEIQFQGTETDSHATEYRKSEKTSHKTTNEDLDSGRIDYLNDENSSFKDSGHTKMYTKYYLFNLKKKRSS